MADDFTLKWDAQNQELYGEDPSTGDRIPVPFDSVNIGKGTIGGSSFMQVINSQTTIGSFDNYIHIVTDNDSEFSFSAFLQITAEDSDAADRYASLYNLNAAVSDITTSKLVENTVGGTVSVNVDYSGVHNGEHTVQIRPDSSSGWASDPDKVTASIIALGKNISLNDET